MTEGLCAQASRRPPWGWHRALRAQSCRGRGRALEMVLAAARLPFLMEALLEMEQSIYPYFCPGIGVFIASTGCCNEHCRNMLLKVLPVGIHLGCAYVCMLTHACTGVHTCTPPLGSPFPVPAGPTLLDKHHGVVIRAAMAVWGQPLPKSCLRSVCFSHSRAGPGRILVPRPVGIPNPPPGQAAGARERLINPLSSANCIGVPKNLPGEMLDA